MFCPAMMVAGPVLVTNTSADALPVTKVTATLLLFSSFTSNTALDIVAILVKKVPPGVPAGMFRVSEKLALPPEAKFGLVQLTVPPEPTAGVVQVQLDGPDRLTKVIPPGSGSERRALRASSGPMFRILIVYVTLLLADAVAGPVLVTARSALGGSGGSGSCAATGEMAAKNRAQAKVAAATALSHVRARNDAP